MSDPTPFAERDPITRSFFSEIKAARSRQCTDGSAPTFDGPKNNWFEALPGFWLPATWRYDAGRWPDYTSPETMATLLDAPEVAEVVHIAGLGQPDPRDWAIWLSSHGCDRVFNGGVPRFGPIADRLYSSARFKYLVPAWRRALIEVITELDDIEDQVSTILWLAETVLRKIIPLPPAVVSAGRDVQRALDKAERLLAAGNPGRGSKAEYAARQREIAEAKRAAKSTHAKLIVWLQENWGKLLEAAQATDTWADVGIALGPIVGYIEGGMWDLAQRGNDGYLIAADAIWPGARAGFYDWARRTDEAIELAVSDTIEKTIEWTTDAMEWALAPATPVDLAPAMPDADLTTDPPTLTLGAP